MPRGTPDYGVYASSGSLKNIVDLGELAARMGTPISIDRGGNVVWQDDFEGSVLRWVTTAVGAGASVALSTTRQLTGIQSCCLTSGSTAQRNAKIDRYLSVPIQGKCGYELSLKVDANVQYCLIELYQNYASLRYAASIMLDMVSSALKYKDELGNYVTLTSIASPNTTLPLFYTVKFVVDFSTGEYVRVRWGNRLYDMSGLRFARAASTSDEWLQVRYQINSNGAVNGVSYVDGVIITQNES